MIIAESNLQARTFVINNVLQSHLQCCHNGSRASKQKEKRRMKNFFIKIHFLCSFIYDIFFLRLFYDFVLTFSFEC